MDESNEELLKFEMAAEEEGWEEAYNNVRGALGLPTDGPTPPLPRSPPSQNGNGPPDGSTDAQKQAYLHAQAAASYIPFLSPEDLLQPKMPTRQEMDQVLLELRKKALVEEYFGNS